MSWNEMKEMKWNEMVNDRNQSERGFNMHVRKYQITF